jgi:hypothetical protein
MNMNERKSNFAGRARHSVRAVANQRAPYHVRGAHGVTRPTTVVFHSYEFVFVG